MAIYIINERFTIKPERNEINEVKVEPRIMKLLCLLIENKGNLVSRSYITELIWEGYGGGDEGLTQAISLLRKILEDSDKKVIETIPKSGYIFNGIISSSFAEKKVATPFPKNKSTTIKWKYAVAAGLVLLVLVGFSTYQKTGQRKYPASKNSFADFRSKHNLIHALKHAVLKNNERVKKLAAYPISRN